MNGETSLTQWANNYLTGAVYGPMIYMAFATGGASLAYLSGVSAELTTFYLAMSVLYADMVPSLYEDFGVMLSSSSTLEEINAASNRAILRPGLLLPDLIGIKITGPRAPKSVENETRTFSSPDPHVADLANKIEGLYPGHVKGVNVLLKDKAGNIVTDADILLNNSVIQVKGGGGKGLTTQDMIKTPKGTSLPVIGYGPNLKGSVVKGIEKSGGLVTTNEALLLEVIKP